MKELIAIQRELKAPKNQFNKFGGYRYRSAEDILEAVKPLLAKYNCHLVTSDEILAVNNCAYIKATATLTNEAGETITASASAREEPAKKGMDAAQITGAASSYARKYAFNGLFAIDDTKDPDVTNTHDEGDKAAEANFIKRVNAAKSIADLSAIYEEASSLGLTNDGSPLMTSLSAKKQSLKTA